jgi:hypothetical protein
MIGMQKAGSASIARKKIKWLRPPKRFRRLISRLRGKDLNAPFDVRNDGLLKELEWSNLPNIAEVLSKIDQGMFIRHLQEEMKLGSNIVFAQLAVAKENRVKELKNSFKRKAPTTIFFSNGLVKAGTAGQSHDTDKTISTLNTDIVRDGFDIRILPFDFFSHEFSALEHKVKLLDNAIVIVNNNCMSSGYAETFHACPNTLFTGWDYDNHHWFKRSLVLAACSDLYVPAHHENLYLLSRFNWLTAGPVYAGIQQWPLSLLSESLPRILQSERSAAPLGQHIRYPQFPLRNQVVTSVGASFSTVGFSTPQYHAMPPDERLNEWIAHKTHWITPVLNDVPIRLFDALVTGGIPIVPESQRFLPCVRDIPRDFICFYGISDVLDPKAVVERANFMFDAGGQHGIAARYQYALENHHISVRINSILDLVANAFDIVTLQRGHND